MTQDDKNLFIPNIDEFIRSVSETMPFADSEVLYLSELESQKRIFFMFLLFGVLLILFGVML